MQYSAGYGAPYRIRLKYVCMIIFYFDVTMELRHIFCLYCLHIIRISAVFRNLRPTRIIFIIVQWYI